MKDNRHSLPYYWSKAIDGNTYEMRGDGNYQEHYKIQLFENGDEIHSWIFAEDEELIHFGNVFFYHLDGWIVNEERVRNYLINYPFQMGER